MTYLIVINGIVDNIIEADDTFAPAVGALPYYDGAAIGSPYNPPHEPTLTERVTDLEEALDMILTGVTE